MRKLPRLNTKRCMFFSQVFAFAFGVCDSIGSRILQVCAGD